MSLDTTQGDPVHYPARRDLFQFDKEVASIFDNMAPRSIPMYNEVHRLHVSLLRDRLVPGVVVADIGSSTGHLFRNISKELKTPFEQTGIHGLALDASAPMMSRLSKEFPTVQTIVQDIRNAPDLEQPAGVMFCLYTVQFVPPHQKNQVFDWLVRNTAVNGVIVLGQKEQYANSEIDERFSQEYYKFRRDNGYTQQEIDAKTAALKNSMWTSTPSDLDFYLRVRNVDVYETSRWLQFSSVIGIRRQ